MEIKLYDNMVLQLDQLSQEIVYMRRIYRTLKNRVKKLCWETWHNHYSVLQKLKKDSTHRQTHTVITPPTPSPNTHTVVEKLERWRLKWSWKIYKGKQLQSSTFNSLPCLQRKERRVPPNWGRLRRRHNPHSSMPTRLAAFMNTVSLSCIGKS